MEKEVQYWLMKSEPETFSIEDLQQAPGKITCWEGVRNYQARNFMNSTMRIGDQAFFYHSNCKVPGIVGIVKVASDSYPDHTQFDPESDYYDPKSTPAKPRWFMRDVKFIRKFKNIVPLSDLKAKKSLEKMQILQRGNRLSITPVDKKDWQTILEMVEQA